jgi:hypothetical protein
MATLSSLLKSRQVALVETNLDVGQVWAYTQGSVASCLMTGFCWKSPGTGTAVIEVWGSGGSSARMCCCGATLPGNAGAYSKKTISVNASSYVCGCTGRAFCGLVLCDRGCGDPTGLCWIGASTNGCMCSQGGKGGTSICSTSTSAFCCFYAGGFCGALTNPNHCGVICNMCSGGWVACGYGGDVNCCGLISCAYFGGCYPECTCYFHYYVPLAPGQGTEKGTYVGFVAANDSSMGKWSGAGLYPYMAALGSVSSFQGHGSPIATCWSIGAYCGCYDTPACMRHVPVGGGAPPGYPCSSVRDNGVVGGDGAVRIRFY